MKTAVEQLAKEESEYLADHEDKDLYENGFIHGYKKAKEMEKEQQLIKVKAIQDDLYRWYVIPNELHNEFALDERVIDFGEFDVKWGKYRTGGDLNLIQLYTYGGN
jgi:hypothetical protein